MINIRNGMFETNSSSVHSIVISDEGIEENKMKIARRKRLGQFGKFIVVKLGKFGTEPKDYMTQEEKLSYLVTIAYLKDGGYDIDRTYSSYSFRDIERDMMKHCSCDGIWIDPASEKDASIDHQTIEDYWSVSDFSGRMGLSYEDFVFNRFVALHTDSD